MAVERTPGLPPPDARARRARLALRPIGLAADVRNLVLAAIGLALTRPVLDALQPLVRGPVGPPTVFGRTFDDPATLGLAEGLADLRTLYTPFATLFRPDVPASDRLAAAFAGAVVLLVWSVVGGAIVRIAAVRVASEKRLGLVSALRFTVPRLPSLVTAPAWPLAVALVFGLAGAGVGLVSRLSGATGAWLAGLAAIVPLVVAVFLAVVLLGLALAWPLMVATVVVEGEDFFDAVSRSYSYINQRTLRTLALVARAVVLGAIGLALVWGFARATLVLADGTISLGAAPGGGPRFLGADPSGTLRVWVGLVRLIVGGWVFSYAWATVAVVYLILREEVDGAETHDIFEPAERTAEFVPTPETPAVEPSAD